MTREEECITRYHMGYASPSVRTSMSLDTGTLSDLDALAKRWAVSKAEVMRRAIRKMKEDVEAEDQRPSPLQALEWLQGGAGLSMAEGEQLKADVAEERRANRYWWES